MKKALLVLGTLALIFGFTKLAEKFEANVGAAKSADGILIAVPNGVGPGGLKDIKSVEPV